jgi:hypothetical protein
LRAVAVKLDAVSVGVAQVKGLGDAVVRGAVYGVVGFQKPLQRDG